MNDFIIGTSALDDANSQLLKETGIGWIRAGFPFPFSDRIGGSLTNEYLDALDGVKHLLE